MSDNAPPPMPQPHPNLKQLEFLVGSWKLTGVTEESPMGPAAKLEGTETFEWLPGGFFLVHKWDSSFETPAGSMPDVGYEFFDCDPETGEFRSHYFSSFGPYHPEQSHYKGSLDGDKLTLVGPARYVRQVKDESTVTYDCDMPIGPDTWAPFMHATLSKIK